MEKNMQPQVKTEEAKLVPIDTSGESMDIEIKDEEEKIESDEQQIEEKDVEDTILHEIAHALSFLKYGKKGTGHGVFWKQMCRKIGAKPNRIHQGVVEYPNNHYKYSSTCCGHTWGMHRMGKGRRYLCPKCDRILVFKTKNKSLTYI